MCSPGNALNDGLLLSIQKFCPLGDIGPEVTRCTKFLSSQKLTSLYWVQRARGNFACNRLTGAPIGAIGPKGLSNDGSPWEVPRSPKGLKEETGVCTD